MTGSQGRQAPRSRWVVVGAMGFATLVGWATSFFFPAVFAAPIVADTGWPLTYVVSGASLGMLISGIVAPQIGKWIGTHGGRPVVLASSPLFAAGLVGMGAGLYDALFATLGRMYGQQARGPITNITLLGGLASTVGWPVSAFLIAQIGWRNTCFAYAAVHVLVSWPMLWATVRGEHGTSLDDASAGVGAVKRLKNEWTILALLAVSMTLTFGAGALIGSHLFLLIESHGIDRATAIAIGTLYGPAQVAVRIAESLLGSRYHSVWTMVGAVVAMAIGWTLFGAAPAIVALALMVFSAGYGIAWVARGTVPLALFGARRFPALLGKLSMPGLLAQAAAPTVGAILIERIGAAATIELLTGTLLVNVVLVMGLLIACWPHLRVR